MPLKKPGMLPMGARRAVRTSFGLALYPTTRALQMADVCFARCADVTDSMRSIETYDMTPIWQTGLQQLQRMIARQLSIDATECLLQHQRT